MNTTRSIITALEKITEQLNVIEKRKHAEKGFTHPADFWHSKERNKYIAMDCGNSGAFLVEKPTGEIYNIMGYGQADKNKKIKADLGNITTVDPEFLHARRWNYLR